MEDLGEKLKTHVSKISSGAQAENYPYGKLKSHKDFHMWNNQNIKTGFSPWILLIDYFLTLSSVFKSDEQKPKYCDLKILVDNQIGCWRFTTSRSKNILMDFFSSSLWLIKLIAIEGIEFWMSKTQFISFRSSAICSDQGRWRVTRR